MCISDTIDVFRCCGRHILGNNKSPRGRSRRPEEHCIGIESHLAGHRSALHFQRAHRSGDCQRDWLIHWHSALHGIHVSFSSAPSFNDRALTDHRRYFAAAVCLVFLRGWKVGEVEELARIKAEGVADIHDETVAQDARSAGRRRILLDFWRWQKV